MIKEFNEELASMRSLMERMGRHNDKFSSRVYYGKLS